MNIRDLGKLPNDASGLAIKILLGSAFGVYLLRLARQYGSLSKSPQGYRISVDRKKLDETVQRTVRNPTLNLNPIQQQAVRTVAHEIVSGYDKQGGSNNG